MVKQTILATMWMGKGKAGSGEELDQGVEGVRALAWDRRREGL